MDNQEVTLETPKPFMDDQKCLEIENQSVSQDSSRQGTSSESLEGLDVDLPLEATLEALESFDYPFLHPLTDSQINMLTDLVDRHVVEKLFTESSLESWNLPESSTTTSSDFQLQETSQHEVKQDTVLCQTSEIKTLIQPPGLESGCTTLPDCPLPNHRSEGPFAKDHITFEQRNKFPLLWTLNLAITSSTSKFRQCLVCSDSNKTVLMEGMQNSLRHVRKVHGHILGNVQNDQEALTLIRSLIRNHPDFKMKCPHPECDLECSEATELFIHWKLIHVGLPTARMICCPICFTALAGQELTDHWESESESHKLLCCGMTEWEWKSWFAHKLQTHLQDLLKPWTKETRIALADAILDTKTLIPWVNTVPIFIAEAHNQKAPDIFQIDIFHQTPMDAATGLLERLMEFNEKEKYLARLDSPDLDPETWKSLVHEFTEFNLWSKLLEMLDTTIRRSFWKMLSEQQSKALRGSYQHCQTCQDYADHSQSRERCKPIDQQNTKAMAFGTFGEFSLTQDTKGILIGSCKGPFNRLPSVKEPMINLSSYDKKESYPTIFKERKFQTRTPNNIVTTHMSNYFSHVNMILEKTKWTKGLIYFLDFFLTDPKCTNLVEAFYQILAFFYHASCLKEQYQARIMVLLPLPLWKRRKQGEETKGLYTLFRQIHQIAAITALQCKITPIPTMGMLESQPMIGRQKKINLWKTAACNIPLVDEPTFSPWCAPTREFMRRFSVLLNTIFEANKNAENTVQEMRKNYKAKFPGSLPVPPVVHSYEEGFVFETNPLQPQA